MNFPIKQSVYMPKDVCRFFRQMHEVVQDCIAYIVYYYKIKELAEQYQTSKERDWFIFTRNGYYDLAIGRWCMLFGSYKEPTHYIHILDQKYNLINKIKAININITKKESLKKYILSIFNIPDQVFDTFQGETKSYRNKYLIHRDHDNDDIYNGKMRYPRTEIIIRTAYSLYKIIISLAASFPSYADTECAYKMSYYLFNNKDDLTNYLIKTLPNFK